MEPIQNSMKKIARNSDFSKRFDHLKQEVLKDNSIKAFLRENNIASYDPIIDKGLVKLYEYLEQSHSCEKCPSLQGCQNLLKGYQPILAFEKNYIDVRYEKCDKRITYEENQVYENLFQSMYIPKNLLNASISNLYHEEGRLKVLEAAAGFVHNINKQEFQKGLYLYGSFGTGKTYVLAAIANELAKKKVRSLLIYIPEFMREMKNSLQDQSINRKIESIKQVPILMLDDLGAETMSSWFRDEILGTILQYRMSEGLPIFFSSNLSFKELEHHLTYSQRGEVEGIKAARIMERIKYLTKPLEMTGKNYRNHV